MYEWLSNWFSMLFASENPSLTNAPANTMQVPNHGITPKALQMVQLRPSTKINRCPFSAYQLREHKQLLKPIAFLPTPVKLEPEAIYKRNHLRPTSQQLW